MTIDIKNKLKSLDKINIDIVTIALFVSLFIMNSVYTILIFQRHPLLTQFKDRVISMATVAGYDISKRICMMYLYLVILLVGFILGYFILNALYSKTNKMEEHFILLRDFSIFGIVAIVCSYFLARVDAIVNYLGIIEVLALLTILVLRFLNIYIEAYMLEWNILLAIPISIFIKTMFGQRISSYLVVGMVYCLGVIVLIGLQKSKKAVNTKQNDYILVRASSWIFITALVQSILLEICNVLNRRGIWMCNSPKRLYFLVFIGAIIIAMGSAYVNHKKSDAIGDTRHLLENTWYMVFIITTVALVVQPGKQIAPWNEYFETANHGLAFDRLFRYGEIPIVENFDAHMLFNQITGVIYYILNGYEPWAFNLYSGYMLIPIEIIAYLIFSKIYGKRNMLLLICTFPFASEILNDTPSLFSYFVLLGIVLLILYKLLDDREKWKPIYFWLGIVVVSLMLLDMGVAACIAGVITYIIVQVIGGEKDIKVYFRFFINGVIVLVSALIVFVGSCVIKNIPVMDRIKEFIKLVCSNQNWAYNHVGDQQLMAFALTYYIAPIILIGLMLMLAVRLIRYKKIVGNQYATIGFIYFSIAYLTNISRGVVRHSLAENIIGFILAYFPLAILCFCIAIEKNSKYRTYKLAGISMTLILLMNINVLQMHNESSLIQRVSRAVEDTAEYDTVVDLSSSRVQGDILNNDEVKVFKNLLDTILDEDQTYLDMASLNYYYALVGRKCPVYVNQSPLMLSGDWCQREYIEEIESENVPLAIVPKDCNGWRVIDGINVLDKYYVLSEYIYKNYEPLVSLEQLDVWCLKDKKEEYDKKLGQDYEEQTVNLKQEIDRIVTNDASLKESDEGIVMITKGNDPYISYLLQNQHIEGRSFKVTVSLLANESGKVQIFYKKKGTEFNEEDSKWFDVEANTKATLTVDIVGELEDIRIDCNDIQEVNLYNLSIQQSDGIYSMIGQAEAINNLSREHFMGLVPWYWANYDEKSEMQKLDLTSCIENYEGYKAIRIQDTNEARNNQYLYLSIDSKVDQDINVCMKDDQGRVLPSTYKCRVLAGVNNYRIRISDYGWYSGAYQLIEVYGEQEEVTIESAALELENDK